MTHTNKKLTAILKGKVLSTIDGHSPATLHFADSTLVTVLGSFTTSGSPSGTVASILENGTDFRIVLEKGEICFTLDDPGGSLLARDLKGQVIYAG